MQNWENLCIDKHSPKIYAKGVLHTNYSITTISCSNSTYIFFDNDLK